MKSWWACQQHCSANIRVLIPKFTFHVSSKRFNRVSCLFQIFCKSQYYCFLDALASPVSHKQSAVAASITQQQSAATSASSSFWSLFYFNLQWAMGNGQWAGSRFQIYLFQISFSDIYFSDISICNGHWAMGPFSDISWLTNHSAKPGLACWPIF